MKKFVILANPRTGSEYLVKMIDRHKDAFCYSELFQKNLGRDWNESVYRTEKKPFDFLEQKFKETDCFCCGYKQMIPWLQHACFDSFQSFIEQSAKRDYFIIFLKRKDLLKEYMSYEIMAKYRYMHIREKDEQKKYTIKLSPQKAYCQMRSWKNINDYICRLLEEYKNQSLILTYEEDFSDKKLLRQKVFGALGLEYCDIEDPLVKNNIYPIQEQIENYEEVVDYLKNKGMIAST